AVLLSPINPEREKTYEDLSITDPIERERHFGQKDHLREFGRDYAEVLASAGFSVEQIDYASTLSEERVKRMAIASDDISNITNHVFIVRKP
ncbi:MAG: SAM-dependent methyltransferase, partial [Bacteroidales bacterium]|nr:SAM-dependent methyltransferase [Bacteroidales bacterium]